MRIFSKLIAVVGLVAVMNGLAHSQHDSRFQGERLSCDELKVLVEDAVNSSQKSGEYCTSLQLPENKSAAWCGTMAFAYFGALAKERDRRSYSDKCKISGIIQAQLSPITGVDAFRNGDAYYFFSGDERSWNSSDLLSVNKEDQMKTAAVWYSNAKTKDGDFARAFILEGQGELQRAIELYRGSAEYSGVGQYGYFAAGLIYLRGGNGVERDQEQALAAFLRGANPYGNCWSAYMHASMLGQGSIKRQRNLSEALKGYYWIKTDCQRNGLDSELRTAIDADVSKLNKLMANRSNEPFIPSCPNPIIKRRKESSIEVHCNSK